ncbi:alpha/beta hydrolase [Viridothelium virens]|uniref:Alpha/beta hydrolase n=1 Tax=Viridothelium virens TaxID=1048519 RepID=A0A6A6H6G2_VIRVR|nr:alpha/beta hydrolase [Viridothelium virens]
MPFALDPEVASGLEALTAALPKGPPPAPGDLAAIKEFSKRFIDHAASIAKPAPGVSVQNLSTTSEDSHTVPLYWHTKSGSSPGSVILYLHGGGMVASSAASYRPIVSYLVSHSGVPALSVEFRNAPYSAPLQGVQDAYAGLIYLSSHAADLKIDPERIVVVGDSGGGGLAACLTHLVRERQGPRIAKQVLIYPMLDDRLGLASPDLHMAPFLTVDHATIDTCWVGILGSRRGAEDVQPTEAAARMESAAGLPSMYLDVGDCDIFRDDCLKYVNRFWAEGIPAELHVWNGCYHGFDGAAPEARVTQRAWDARARAIQEV